ncbi:hypothetical protein L226DRAFT_539817 [Lentinus tigrinus ALCF2SS1-7]|uniref:uncharacterized protein n=1 Tax=Lentinus tigrinus ALCF2SS1-7 TaxID=1328758 RepID=UPI001165F7FA|nr:hypothetical protein L226DRAFT_539817 [Lentinus tigrinus ALCF2SS1-7]
MAVTIAPLPPFPSTRARATLSPSQSATLVQTISSALSQVISLADAQISTPATLTFVSTYVKDAAQQTLQALVWGADVPSKTLSQAERKIRHAVFLLAERLAPLGALDLQTLVDLSVAYARVSASRLRAPFLAAFVQAPKASALLEDVRRSALPAFTTLLRSSAQGLYGLRKTACIILSFLRPAPPDVARIFAREKTFTRALAAAYHSGLASLAQTYGGLRNLSASLAAERELDEWERLFLETKVALLDTFHILVRTLLDDVASVASAGSNLAAQAEPAFEVIFDLLELPSGAGADGLSPTPFLNRPLLADYQHAYDFSKTLADVLRRTEDARTDLIESSLRSMSEDVASGSREPGALKLILRSSGIQPGIDNLGRGPAPKPPADDVKGKRKATSQRLGTAASGVPDEQVDMAVAQVLELLSDQDPGYVRYLLSHDDYPYRGDAERLIAALLDGTAPSPVDVQAAMAAQVAHPATPAPPPKVDEFAYTKERRNIWDEEKMDLAQVRIGKKSGNAEAVLEDRSFIEQMKADILRRAEEVSDSEDEETDPASGKGKGKAIAFEDELDDGDRVVVRDGLDSDDDEEGTEGEDDGTGTGAVGTPRNPETVLELAYIQDPKLFDRDGQTRRSKARGDLKAQTGYTDEQIEGWKIMLERDPKKKEKMLAKHEFTGNKPLNAPFAEGSQSEQRGGGGGRSRGRGRGRGRGGGAGGRGGGPHDGTSGGGGDAARDRAWKDKNKARRANHDRKRGHDKKMARGGGPS